MVYNPNNSASFDALLFYRCGLYTCFISGFILTFPLRGIMTVISSGFLFKGFLIGLAIAAPVGPIGVLCIRRTLVSGRLIGFLSGLGAATADSAYAAVAAFGLTAVQSLLVGTQFWLHWIGSIPDLSWFAHVLHRNQG